MMTRCRSPRPPSPSIPRCPRHCAPRSPVVALESTIISHGMPFPQQRRHAHRGRATRCATEGAAGHHRRARRRTAASVSPPTSCTSWRPPRISSRRRHATCRGCSPPAPPARRPSRRRCASPRSPASGCSPPAASAACIGRGDVVRRVRGPHRARRHAGGGRLGGDQVDPRHQPDARAPGVCRRPRRRQRQRRLPVVLQPVQRPAAPRRVDGAVAIARLLHATWNDLRMPVGVSIANPIPAEAEIPAADIDAVIDEALGEADRRAITGQAVTPFLLARVVERTAGRSLAANDRAGAQQRRDRGTDRRRVCGARRGRRLAGAVVVGVLLVAVAADHPSRGRRRRRAWPRHSHPVRPA